MVERRYDDGAESQSRLRSASSYLRFGNSEDCRSRSISAAPNNKEACRHACGYADIVTAVLLNRQDQKTAIESRRASTPIHDVLLGGADHFRDDLIPLQLDSKPSMDASKALELNTASVLREPTSRDAGPIARSATQLCAASCAWRELQIEPILRCQILPSLYQFSRKESQ